MARVRQDRVTIEELLALRSPSEVAVAPEGAPIAFTLRTVDFERGCYVTQLHLTERLAGRWQTRQLTQAAESSSHPRWSPEGNLLAFESARKQTNNNDAHKQVWLLDTRGGEARPVTRARNGVLHWHWIATSPAAASRARPGPAAKWALVYTTEAARPPAEQTVRDQARKRKDDPALVHRDLRNREFWLQPLEGAARRLSVGDPGVGSFAVSENGKFIVFTTNRTGIPADSDRFDLYLLEVATGRRRRLTRRPGSERAPRFSLDGKWVSFFATFDEKVHYSRNDVWIVAVGGGEPRNLSAALDRDVEAVCWSADSRSLLAVCQWGTYSRLVSFDLRGRSRVLHESDEVLHDLALSRDGRTLAVIAESPTQPPEVWTTALRRRPDGALAARSAERVTELNPQVRGWELPRRQRVRWHHEGYSHEGILFTPAHASGPMPLVVLLHGGPHSRAANTFVVYNHPAWCAEGYAVFVPNYRGSSGVSNAYGVASRRDLGGGDYRDLMTGVDRVTRRPDIDGARCCVAGGSYGGYLTNWIIGHTDRFRAAVSLFGIFSLFTDFSNSENPNWDPAYLGCYWWEDWQRYHDHSPAQWVTAMRTPVLILHGDEDRNTFLANSNEMYQALRTLGRTVEFVRYPREGHGFREPHHQLDQFRRMLTWFDRHAGADGGGRRSTPPSRPGTWVSGVAHELQVVRCHSVHDYAGVQARGHWLEVTLLVQPRGGARRCTLKTQQCRLRIGRRRLPPAGVAVTTLGETLLLRTQGELTLVPKPGAADRTLAAALVFEVPAPGYATLEVAGFPPISLVIPPAGQDK